jgi:hypothetical protein
MYQKLIFLTSFIFVLALAGYALAQDAEIPPLQAPETPIIDGVREDAWSVSEEHPIAKLDADSWPSSDADCSGSWWALWDFDYLYVFVDVNDESLENDSGESWQDDSIEIYVDAGNDKPNRYAPAGDEYQYRAAWNPDVPEFQEYHHGNRSVPGVEFIILETDDGYTLEIKFPWESLYVEGKPTLGDLMGFEVMINDGDDGGNRETQLSWFSEGNSAWNNPSVFGTVVFAAGVKPSNPIPRHGTTGVTSGLLQWIEAKNAASYDVYFGTNPTPGANELIQNQTETEYTVANIDLDTTYYWRIDAIMPDMTVVQGNVWSFTSAPLTAHSPDPADGARWIELDADLNWQPGMYAKTHDVYLGTDETAVNNADISSDEFKGNQDTTTFEPGTLLANTTYYWRIDEVNDQHPDASWKGDIWSFTALGAGQGIKAEYYDNVNLTGQPTLTRIDETINYDWGTQSPDELISEDSFSIRWTAELEIPYTETYTFITNIFLSDGIRLWVNGQLLIDHWSGEEPWERKASIHLPAGQATIMVEYFDAGHRAVARLSWESPSISREIIPKIMFYLPTKAVSANPPNNSTGVAHTPILRWDPGDGAVNHYVFFGSDYNDVADANINTPGIYRGQQDLDDTSYIPTETPLEWNKTYYWRIDEYSADGSINEGHIWSFTTADYIILDWFEEYIDSQPDRIFDTWKDGWGIADNGSQIGYNTPPFAEQEIVNSGLQSMPFLYDNTNGVAYSEAYRTFDAPFNDWNRENAQTLTLFFKGYAPAFLEDPADTYTMSASGLDIWDLSDQFRYAYKRLSGNGYIIARVVSLENTNEWAKAGVMIRDSLDDYSVHAFMCVTPSGRSAFQNRQIIGSDSFTASSDPNNVTTPVWVKIVRQVHQFSGYYSTDGVNWIKQQPTESADDTSNNPQIIPMSTEVYIGLAHTSHNINLIGTSVFSDVKTVGNVTGDWQVATIGTETGANDAQPLYLAVEDTSRTVKIVEHPDNPNAVLATEWQQWDIPLSVFSDADVDLNDVDKLYLGIGSKTAPQDGKGTVYFDDIRLYPAEE